MDAGFIVKLGTVVMLTVTAAVAVQAPFAPVTVYVVLLAGDAVTLAPLALLRPAAGFQVYVVAPEAESVADDPAQILVNVGVSVSVGRGVTLTVRMAELVQVPLDPSKV